MRAFRRISLSALGVYLDREYLEKVHLHHHRRRHRCHRRRRYHYRSPHHQSHD